MVRCRVVLASLSVASVVALVALCARAAPTEPVAEDTAREAASAPETAPPPQIDRDDPLAAIAKLVRVHSDDEALAALAKLPDPVQSLPRARYLRARLLERTGDRAGALAALTPPIEGLPEPVALGDRRRRARLLFELGRCAEARPLLLALGEGTGDQPAQMRALAARCAVALGDYAAAIPELRAAIKQNAGPVDGFMLRLRLGEALAATGDRAGAEAAFVDALIARAGHPDENLAREAYEKLTGHPVAFTDAQHLARADRFSRLRRYSAAVEDLKAVELPDDRTARAHLLHLRGMALYRTRSRYGEAATVLHQASLLALKARPADKETAASDAYYAARALARSNDNEGALAALRRYVRRFPRSEHRDDAAYLAAWLELRMGERGGHAKLARRGERAMEVLLRRRSTRDDPTMREEIAWQLAFRAFETRRYAEAEKRFARYAALDGDTLTVETRGTYWQGRAAEARGRRQAAARAYRETIAQAPLHWYSLLAARRLETMHMTPPAPFPPADDAQAPPPLPTPPLPPAVVFFDSLGLHEDAVAALQEHEAAIRDAAPRGRGDQLLVATYRRIDEVTRPYRLARAKLRGVTTGPDDPSTGWIWAAAYPRPYRHAVLEATASTAVPPGYVYATMRQESSFNPIAVSPAGAVGVLQLMPRTARAAAHTLGVPFKRERLYDPAWNIRLGVVEMAAVLARHGGAIPLTVAAYNAGSGRVRGWLEREGATPLDVFVERIPFRETRNYVRHVVSHYAVYHYLAHREAPWKLDLPMTVGPKLLAPSD